MRAEPGRLPPLPETFESYFRILSSPELLYYGYFASTDIYTRFPVAFTD